MIRALATGLVVLSLAACSQNATRSQQTKSPLLSFELLGCGGDWPSDTPARATIQRLTLDDKVTFLVRHPDTCGLTAARKPSFRVDQGELQLSYDLYSPDDSVVMCECEYVAKFTFDQSMMMVKKVRFAEEEAQNVWAD
jgi:hypothetical protein